ncbi:MAG: B12-binding domain-containing radical SAM protein [Candidatus Obscuribacterales bacterium]|nr:B12-binding domain-containing radical SAM protein [Candidatus Obscuribacterales bacterium]
MFPGEKLLVKPPPKAPDAIKVAWAYPNSYAVGMAGLGYQLVWWLLEQQPDVSTYRVFSDMVEPGWEDAKLLGFTLSWELDYANVLQILRKAAIPALSAERSDDAPLIFGGGPVLSANPEPFAAIFDVVLLGDAEATIPALLAKWRECSNLAGRENRLRELATVSGVYVPSLYNCTYTDGGALVAIAPIDDTIGFPLRQVFTPPDDYVAHSVILSDASSWVNMFLVEVARSCPQECRFCLASYLTRPFRSANVDTLMQKIDLGLQYTRKVGLLGPSVTEHPRFAEIAERLLARGHGDLDLSIASIRMDTVDPLVLRMLVELGQKSVTVALESGSERLRSIMKKNLSEAEILKGCELIEQSGLEAIKFYGIVGLPGETDDDLQETVRLLTFLKKKHKRLRITFGVSSFVPKAQTPFQWFGRDKQSAKKLEFMRKNLARTGIEVRPESHNWSDVQAYLSRGDRRITPSLLAAAEASANLGAWKKAWRNQPKGCPPADFFIYANKPYDEVLPWSHLTDTLRQGMLVKHSRNAEELAVAGAGSANSP